MFIFFWHNKLYFVRTTNSATKYLQKISSMGCSTSRSLQTLPASRSSSSPVPIPVTIGNYDWIVYAPVRHNCPRSRSRSYSYESSYASLNPSACGTSQSRSRSYESSYASSNPSQWLGNSTCSRSYSDRSTPPFTSSSYTTSSHSLDSNPIRTPTTNHEISSRSLLSTPTFHSPSSHPRNGLTLNPALFSNHLFSNDGSTDGHFDTDCESTPTPHPKNGLTLDPILISNTNCHFLDKVRNTKIDTDCASRFSNTSGSPSFTSSTSSFNCFDKSYPLRPLSVRTEPFPR